MHIVTKLLDMGRHGVVTLFAKQSIHHRLNNWKNHAGGTKDTSCAACQREADEILTHRPEAIANEFLRRLSGLTHMQLQKLVYIAHGWNLAVNGNALVDREPEAWDRGPVFSVLREHLKSAGNRPIEGLIHENDDNPFAFFGYERRGRAFRASLTTRQRDVINQVSDKYGRMGVFRLSDLTTRRNTPWHKTYYGESGQNAHISNDLIREYYLELGRRVLPAQAPKAM